MKHSKSTLSVLVVLVVGTAGAMVIGDAASAAEPSAPQIAEPSAPQLTDPAAEAPGDACQGASQNEVNASAMMSEYRCCPTCPETDCSIVDAGCCNYWNAQFVCHQYAFPGGPCSVGSCSGDAC